MTGATTLGLDLTTDVLVPTIAAAIAVAVALITRHFQLRDKHRDDLRALFAEALSAVADYQELPYLIRRRSDVSPMTTSDLSWHASQVQTRLDLFVARIQLESTQLGDAFEQLVRTARTEAGTHITDAWNQERILTDAAMVLGTRYPRDHADAERATCLALMRTHIGIKPGR